MRVTVTAYVTTLLCWPPLVPPVAAGTIWVSTPATEALAAFTATVAAWPTLSLVTSDSEKLATATSGPTDSSIA